MPNCRIVVRCKNNLRMAGNRDKATTVVRCSVASSERVNDFIKDLDKAAKNAASS